MPAPGDLRAALQEVRSLYLARLADSTQQARETLAEMLRERGRTLEAGSAHQYAMWVTAVDVASEAGLLEASFGAVDELADSYAVDRCELRVEAFRAVVDATSSGELAALALPGVELLEQVVDGLQPQAGDLVVEALRAPVAAFDDASLTKTFESLKGAVGDLRKVVRALKRLEHEPNHSASRRVVGEYLCFRRRDFEAGVPHLAASTDKRLQRLAALDLAAPAGLAARLDAAEAWFELGRKESGDVTEAAFERCEHWLDLAGAEADGLDQFRVEDRRSALTAARAELAEKRAAASPKRPLEWREARYLPGDAPFTTLGSPMRQFTFDGGRYASTWGAQKDKDIGVTHCAIKARVDSALTFSVHGGPQRVVLVLESQAPPRTTTDIVGLATSIEAGAYGTVLQSIAGRRDNKNHIPVTWDLSPYAGQTLRVYILDTSKRGWGFVSLSEIVHRWRQ
ncbi:MAG: hypothetical protein R3F49_05355 [Planctomycetota bacterium]